MSDKRCKYSECGKSFTPTRLWQKYCHPACRQADFARKNVLKRNKEALKEAAKALNQGDSYAK